MPSYWKNDLPTQMCWLPDGRKVPMDFTTGPKGVGYLATELGYINTQIANAIARHIGGWSATTAEEYNSALELKKKAQASSQNGKWNRPDLSLARRKQGGQAGVAGAGRGVEVPMPPRPDPIRVPTPEQMRPRKGPIPKEAII